MFITWDGLDSISLETISGLLIISILFSISFKAFISLILPTIVPTLPATNCPVAPEL